MASSLNNPPQNGASRACRLLYESFTQSDWQRFEALLADDFIVDDRRKVIGGVSGGRRAFLQTWRTIAEQGYDQVYVSDIAKRGETVALQHFLARGTHDFTAEALAVTEIRSSRLTYTAVFDAESLDAAFAELDACFIAGEGASYADAIRIAATMSRAYNARDWRLFASVVATDFVLVDHVPASAGRLSGRDQYVDYVRQMAELAPDMRQRILRDHALSTSGGVSEARLYGSTSEGAEVEVAWIDVAVVRDGLLRHLEQYPTDELPAALARADELSVT